MAPLGEELGRARDSGRSVRERREDRELGKEMSTPSLPPPVVRIDGRGEGGFLFPHRLTRLPFRVRHDSSADERMSGRSSGPRVKPHKHVGSRRDPGHGEEG